MSHPDPPGYQQRRRPPDLSNFTLTPEEREFLTQERRRAFFSFQLPATFGSMYGAYYLMRQGIWSKGTGALPYAPKCAAVGFGTYALCAFISAYRTMNKLKDQGGNFSQLLRGERSDINSNGPPEGYSQSDSYLDLSNKQSIDDILNSNPSTSQTGDIDTRRSTYDELRKQNRQTGDYKQSSAPPPVYKPAQSPPSRLTPQPSPDSSAGSSGKKNKYGDTWSDS